MDQALVYQDFDTYDWGSFTEFQEGLEQILEAHLSGLKESDPSISAIPAADKQQLIDQAKSFFYCSHTGNILNLDDYYIWKRSKTPKEEVKVEEISEDPPYSSNYQNLVELIVLGKPVPGIKEIPDTVLTEQSSQPLAKQRRKPWEKEDAEPQVLEL